jgi:hypothetical protein
MDHGGRDMSQKSKDILSKAMLGAIAVSLTFGAAQYALGRDLAEAQPGSFQVSTSQDSSSEAVINRAAKADRAVVASAAVQTQTISLRFDGLPDTSVLVRVPVAKEAAKEARGNSAPSVFKSGGQKTAVACEPFVSTLTEIAKQLQPGRCVT